MQSKGCRIQQDTHRESDEQEDAQKIRVFMCERQREKEPEKRQKIHKKSASNLDVISQEAANKSN